VNDSKIYEQFSKIVGSFNEGQIDSASFCQKATAYIAQIERVSADLFQNLSDLIDQADLKPQDRQRLLRSLVNKQIPSSGKLVNDETIEYSPVSKTSVLSSDQPESDASDDSDRNSNPSNANSDGNSSPDSSLLRRLLGGDEGDDVKTVQAGETIRGTYRLESVVGKGGMGEVWKAIDLIQDAGDSRDRYVAIKFLSTEFRRHGNALKALVREFARYKKLIHPNIVRAYELNRDHDAVYIAMEFLEGLPLDRFIKQNPDGISLKEAKPIIKGMCDALDHAHQEGIIHLDFKPGNVFYDANTGISKVIDFGIARLARHGEREETRFDPGSLGAKTNAYATAEMLAETHPQASDDVYGLACVVYELLAGKHPYNKKNAIQAEHENLVVNPIKGLNQHQFKALTKGLACRRKNRTSSAKAFYEAIFPSKTVPDLLNSRGFIKVLAIVTALAVLPFLFTAYESYRSIAIGSEIKQLQSSGIEAFGELDPDIQAELLEDAETRTSLIRYFIQNSRDDEDVIGRLYGYAPRIKRKLLQDREIRGLLIGHYINRINRAIQEDRFRLAKQNAKRISEQYPDSNALAGPLKDIPRKKAERLDQLIQKYNECLYKIEESLIDLAPCLTETQGKLRQLHPASEALNDVRLSTRYSREMETALANGNTKQAQQLLSDWNALYDANSKERRRLELRLIYKKKLLSLISQIKHSKTEELPEFITNNLLKIERNMKLDVLSDPLVSKKLIAYYDSKVADYNSRRRYPDAVASISEAKILFAGDKKGEAAITRLQKALVGTRSEEFNALSEQYWLLLSREEPNSKAIKDVHRRIASIAPKSHLLEYPRVTEIFSDRIESAIQNHKFDLAHRNLEAWKSLKPEEANGKLFKSLNVRREAAISANKLESELRKKLDAAIETGNLQEVQRVLTGLSLQDKQNMLNQLEEPVTKLMLDSIDAAVRANNFELADRRAAESVAIYPLSSLLLASRNDIERLKAKRVSDLVSEFQNSLTSDPLVANRIFQVLNKLDTLESDYLERHQNLFDELKNAIQQVAQNNNGLLKLKEVFLEWNTFNATTGRPPRSEENYASSKNMIALRCLIGARKLKTQGDKSSADDLLRFGLSLDPVSSVKSKLNEELYR